MGRTEAIAGRFELLARQRNVVQEFFEVLLRELAIEPMRERDALFPGQMSVANFLRSILRRAAIAELDERGVVEEPIGLVVDTVVFGVRAFGALGIRLERSSGRRAAPWAPKLARPCSKRRRHAATRHESLSPPIFSSLALAYGSNGLPS